jgi:hypothetical protein
MIAQLASFGSSAKLKSLSSQISDQTNTFSQHSYPAGSGFQQISIMGFFLIESGPRLQAAHNDANVISESAPSGGCRPV